MGKRIAAFLCFPDPQSADEGMKILAGLGYRSITLPEIVDQADANTTFVEASKSPPAEGTEYTEFDDNAYNEIQGAIGCIGDCTEAGIADDEKIDWCGSAI